MKELVGKKVTLVTVNGIAVDGIIFQFSENKIKLRHFDNKTFSIIMNVERDIQMIKVFPEEKQIVISNSFSKSEEKQINKIPDQINKVQEKFREEMNKIPSKEELKIQKIMELKQNLIKEEEEIVKNKLNEHVPSGVNPTNYELPGFFFKK
jgi:hypothetical protein